MLMRLNQINLNPRSINLPFFLALQVLLREQDIDCSEKWQSPTELTAVNDPAQMESDAPSFNKRNITSSSLQ